MASKIPLDIAELVGIWREIASRSTGEKQARFTRLADALDGHDGSMPPVKTILVREVGTSYTDIQPRTPRKRRKVVTEA